jgi:hypothetical protein
VKAGGSRGAIESSADRKGFNQRAGKPATVGETSALRGAHLLMAAVHEHFFLSTFCADVENEQSVVLPEKLRPPEVIRLAGLRGRVRTTAIFK